MDRVKGKVAIVTGGALGIGRAASVALAREGAKVAIADINDEDGKAAVAEIPQNGGEASYWHMDVTDEQAVEKTFADIVARYGQLNILVNNAGIPGYQKRTNEITVDEFMRIINIDLLGVFRCNKHAIPYLLKAGGGSVVNMSSMLGIIGGGDPVYHACKGAVRIMTKSDATVFARDGIRFNSVHPGYIKTPGFTGMITNRAPGKLDEFLNGCAERTPLGRMGTPEDIANGILFLASDEASFITGAELVIDGGFTVQ